MSSIQQINESFLEAFDNQSLARIVKYGLDVDLESITSGGDFTRTVFELTNWAAKNNRLPRLLQEAKGHTQNPEIQELEYTPKIQRTRDLSGSSIGRGLMENRESVEYLIFQLSQLTSELSLVKKILTGTEGNHGVRRTSEDNARSISEVMQILEKMESRQSGMIGDISSLQQEMMKLQISINTPPDIFRFPKAKFILYSMFFLLLLTVVLVGAGAFGWM